MKKYPPDTFFNGHIVVRQESAGYRFSIDAVLLADYTTAHPDETVVDLGTGCGILPLILAYRYPEAQFIGIEMKVHSPYPLVMVKENLFLIAA